MSNSTFRSTSLLLRDFNSSFLLNRHNDNLEAKNIEEVFSFDSILFNEKTRSLFVKFLRQQRNEEQILLLESIEEYEALIPDRPDNSNKTQLHLCEQRLNKALIILNTFIKTGSRREVNISDELRKHVTEVVLTSREKNIILNNEESLENNIFTHVKSEIRFQLKCECYHKFLASTLFEQFLSEQQGVLSPHTSTTPTSSISAPASINLSSLTTQGSKRVSKFFHKLSSSLEKITKKQRDSIVSAKTTSPGDKLDKILPVAPQSPIKPRRSSLDESSASKEKTEYRKPKSNSMKYDRKRRSGLKLFDGKYDTTAGATPSSSGSEDPLSTVLQKDSETWDKEDNTQYFNMSMAEYRKRFVDNTKAPAGVLNNLFFEASLSDTIKLRKILREKKQERERRPTAPANVLQTESVGGLEPPHAGSSNMNGTTIVPPITPRSARRASTRDPTAFKVPKSNLVVRCKSKQNQEVVRVFLFHTDNTHVEVLRKQILQEFAQAQTVVATPRGTSIAAPSAAEPAFRLSSNFTIEYQAPTGEERCIANDQDLQQWLTIVATSRVFMPTLFVNH